MKINAVKRLIESMAFERKYAKDKIQELGVQTFQHVYKILLFPESSFVPGWEKEIRAWYLGCMKYTRIKGGTFKPKDLKYLLLEGFNFRATVEQDVRFTILQNEELEPREISVREIESKVKKFYDLFADSLYANESPENLGPAFKILKD